MTNNPESSDSERPALILVAAGSSSRMGGIKKEYLPMNDGTVLSSAARIFLQTLPFSVVAVTYPNAQTEPERNAHEERCRAALFADSFVANAEHNQNATQFLFVPGGATRQQSVLNALESISRHFEKTDQSATVRKRNHYPRLRSGGKNLRRIRSGVATRRHAKRN